MGIVVHLKQKPHGFTLIELLIVIVIISIVSGVAMLTLNHHQNKEIETLATQITRLLSLAEEEAMLRPATLGLAFTPNTFQFFIYHPEIKNHWQALDKLPFISRSIPSNIQITLQSAGQEIPLDGQPHIMILPSNELSPFVLFIGKKDHAPIRQITGKSDGAITNEAYHAEE